MIFNKPTNCIFYKMNNQLITFILLLNNEINKKLIFYCMEQNKKISPRGIEPRSHPC
jgi:hypothetical protein